MTTAIGATAESVARRGAAAIWAVRLAIGVASLLLAVNVATLIATAAIVVGYPYNLDYGEGIVWQQMLNIAAGHGYAPLRTFPAIVTHYPPVYHLTVLALSRLFGSDGLATGRLVSLAATIATAAMIGRLTAMLVRGGDRRAARLAGWFGGAIFLSCYPVAIWALVMRVDMLAGAFSVAGLIAAFRAVERPRLVYAAVICFVLAIYTKQVSVAAPAAAALALWTVRPALAIRLAALCLATGGVALVGLEAATHGEFLRHILSYNLNRNEPARFALLLPPLRMHLLYLVLAAIGGSAAIRTIVRRRREDDAGFATSLGLFSYLVIKTLMLVMIVKSGGAENYMVEWFGAVAIFAGAAIAPAMSLATGRRTDAPLQPLVLLLLVAAQAWSLIEWDAQLEARLAQRARALSPISAAIARSPKPVIADDMTLIVRAGKPVLLEPAIVAELGSSGRYDQAALVRMIEAHRFGFFVTEGDRGSALFDSRYTLPVAQAIARAYPAKRIVAGLVIHLPAR